MTDRELLELAARAAGVCLHPPGKLHTSYDNWGSDTTCTVCGNDPSAARFAPLADDGDALRLAVKLMIRVSVNRAFRLSIPGSVTVEYPDRDGFYFALGEAVTNGDPYAATRRAITRAAAEIGHQMEEQS